MCESEVLISVIVPVYNRESVLKNCIESILNQTYKNIQLILIDDGSTDNTFFICKNYAHQDSRIQVLHQINRGPASARNAGLDTANGKYIMFVDSDDCIHPSCIEVLYKAIRQFDVSIAICEYAEIGLKPKQCTKLHSALLDTETILKNGMNEKEKTLYCWAKLWHKEVIKNIRFELRTFYEDALFSIEALLHYQGLVVYVKGAPLYYYLRKNDSITKNLNAINLLDSLEIVEIILKKTKMSSSVVKKSSQNYCISAAFFAYLQSCDGNNGDLIKSHALKIIQKYRKNVLLSFSSSLKVKIACLLSIFSMNAVKEAYKLIK